MKNALINLLKVKTLITLAITMVFVYLAITNKLPLETTTMVISMVYTYYFTKKERGDDKNGSNE
jgi:hypothetical protein